MHTQKNRKKCVALRAKKPVEGVMNHGQKPAEAAKRPEQRGLLCVPAIEQVRNEICSFGQVKSLCGEIFAPQM